MANVRDYRTRIRSVKSTQQITRAMKLVSAAKLRRAQERILAARPYARKMLEVLSSLAARANPDRHPLLARRPESRIVVVVITADKGLCGSFNTNILNRGRDLLEGMRDRQVQVDLVGRKARDWFRKRKYATRRVLLDVFRNVTVDHAREVASELIRGFIAAEIDAVHLVYNEFKSVIQQRVVAEPLLPIPRALFGEGAFRDGAEGAPPRAALAAGAEDYIYEPGDTVLFETLLPKHVEIQVYRALLESAAAEHGARMAAMDNATRNAEEMIDTLTLQMNKIRQASITKEILEVVSGAEALR
jgi:F-type H+-transporting ATPase subunit gamma